MLILVEVRNSNVFQHTQNLTFVPEAGALVCMVLILSAPSQFLLLQDHWPSISSLLSCLKLDITIAHFMMPLIGH